MTRRKAERERARTFLLAARQQEQLGWRWAKWRSPASLASCSHHSVLLETHDLLLCAALEGKQGDDGHAPEGVSGVEVVGHGPEPCSVPD